MSVTGSIAGLVDKLAGSILDRQQRRQRAGEELRAVFLRELEEVYPLPVQWPEEIDPYLRIRFSKLQHAVERFRVHLSGKALEDFDRAWRRYYTADPLRIDEQRYWHYMGIHDPCVLPDKSNAERQRIADQKARKDFKRNVDALLRHAR